MPSEVFDAIVIGGGPGGASAATFIALQNHRVLLLERDRFPRHQIGESLLPATIHGICKLLGVSDEVENAGFTKKLGGSFRWGTSDKIWTFKFRDHAWQVERARFDKLLLDNARRKGVDVREGHTVVDTVREDGRIVGVRFSDAQGVEQVARAKFVIDSSGNSSKVYEQVGNRTYSKFFQNVALYGYFEHGKRMAPPLDGNILCAAFDEGWFWYIPLSPTLTSVGAVVSKEKHSETLKLGQEKAFSTFVDACPLIKDFLSGAKRVTEGIYGTFRVRKDYSYCNTRFWSPGLLLVGDAACFIDPVFSSGVHLATYSALLAARTVNTCLRGELDEKVCCDEFEARYRREFMIFFDFLVYFYDMTQAEDSYFWQARKLLGTNEPDVEAFLRLVGGGSTSDEEFCRANRTKRAFFQDVLPAGEQAQTQWETLAGRYSDKTFDPDAWLDRFLGVQASLRGAAPETSPLEGGLQVSDDRLRWQRP